MQIVLLNLPVSHMGKRQREIGQNMTDFNFHAILRWNMDGAQHSATAQNESMLCL